MSKQQSSQQSSAQKTVNQAAQTEVKVENSIVQPVAKETSEAEAFQALKRRAKVLGYSLFKAQNGKLNLEPVDETGDPTGFVVFQTGATLSEVVEWIETSEIAAREQAAINESEAEQPDSDLERTTQYAAENQNYSQTALNAKSFKKATLLEYAEKIGVFDQTAPEEIAALKKASGKSAQLIQMVLEQQAHLNNFTNQPVTTDAAAQAVEAPQVEVAVPAEVVEVPAAKPLSAEYEERLVLLLDSVSANPELESEVGWLLANFGEFKSTIASKPPARAAAKRMSSNTTTTRTFEAVFTPRPNLNPEKKHPSESKNWTLPPASEVKPVQSGTVMGKIVELLEKGSTLEEFEALGIGTGRNGLGHFAPYINKTKGYGIRQEGDKFYLWLPAK